MSDWDTDSEHNSDNEQGAATVNIITYIFIAIDCDDLMFERNGEELSTFKTVLHSCYKILDNYLMKSGKRGFCPIAIGIVSDDSDQIAICDFKDNLPASLKKLRDLCEDSDMELEAKYKRKGTIQMSNFFLQCKSKLNSLPQECRKYIAFITKNDNPVNDDNDQRLCVNQARSFRDFNIFIELLTFNPAFDYNSFFQEILEAANCKFSDEYLTDMLDLNEKLVSLMSNRGSRTYFFPFLGKDNNFEMIEKRYIKPRKILNNVTVTKDTHTEVKEIKKGIELKDTYTLQYSKHKNPMVLNAAENKLLLHDNIPVGFTLLCTHDGDMIELGLHCTDPKFVQKSPRKNSPHFDIFWQYCVDKDSRLICARKYKADGPTRLVQLTPKLINNVRSFLVLGIPYFNDIKYQDIHNPLYQSKSTDDKDIMNAAENLVKSLNFPYDISEFHDTVNCRKWEYIRSELLEEKVRDVPDILDLNVIKEDVSDIVNAFKELTLPTGIKRKAPAKARATKKK